MKCKVRSHQGYGCEGAYIRRPGPTSSRKALHTIIQVIQHLGIGEQANPFDNDLPLAQDIRPFYSISYNYLLDLNTSP